MTDGAASTPASSASTPPITKPKRKSNATANRRGPQKRARVQNVDAIEEPEPEKAESRSAESNSNPTTPTVVPSLNVGPQTSRPYRVLFNFVGNQFVQSKTRNWTPVHDPTSQELITRVPESTGTDIRDAVRTAGEAYKGWRRLPLAKRRSHLLRLIELIRSNEMDLANAIIRDVGKTVEDARSEISRSINMIEAALSVTSVLLGYHFDNVATETHTIDEPLGVCMAVTPFNFPLMIPMWIIPFALTTGNTLILKPSEQAPSVMSILGELFLQAGFPSGVFNIVHGGPAAVDKLLAEPVIKAVSFIGSDEAGAHIHSAAVAAKKRVQANCGVKNHGVVLPDANKRGTLFALAASAFGAAGQRCMGLSTAVFVGESYTWLPELVDIAAQLKVGASIQPAIALGPLISRAAKTKVEGMIQGAVNDGAAILLDGRNVQVPDFPEGNFVGPTIISDVQTYMECYQKEILGPVLVCLHVETLEEAIEMVNDNPYGNGCSIFTSSAKNAQIFQREVNVGRIGINVPLIATSGQISNSSNKDSFLGDINVHGFKGHSFFITTKTISSIWRD
ncbi:methylmalonate-semialdehyde dehydrogenase [Delphinella strobiligena]|nr:methylmalonate-semialdehyde dehydrogenase [Delphinella strobiligena]